MDSGKATGSKLLHLPKEFVAKGKSFKGENHTEESSTAAGNCPSSKVFSVNSIMKLARSQLDLFKSQDTNPISTIGNYLRAESDLPSEVSEDLELALLVQASAEKVANRNFANATRLLSLCDDETYMNGTPLQRTVFYFSRALKERIDRELGFTSQGPKEKFSEPTDVAQTLASLEPAVVECQQELPLTTASDFTGAQSLLDSVASAKRVHFIDFGIKNGSLWTLVIQALAVRHECPPETLKITAVGTSKEMMEETGKRLSSFAESMNLSFSFKIVVSDLKDLKQDLFELEAYETLTVYLGLRLWTLLPWSNHLEAVIGVIKHLKPCAIVIIELEASLNSPIFLERFTEALFYFSALFESVKDSLGHHKPCRKLVKKFTFGR